jgi:hypothetical protein
MAETLDDCAGQRARVGTEVVRDYLPICFPTARGSPGAGPCYIVV